MATIQGLIDEINRISPNHGYDNAVLIEWFNKLQKRIYKYMTALKKYEFTSVADQETYNLPTDCKIDDIIFLGLCTDETVTADSIFKTYKYKGLNEYLAYGSYYNGLESNIGLYPIPDKTGYNLKMIYNKRPSTLTTSDLTYVPDLNEDYHDIYVYDVCQRIFSYGHSPNATMANYYEAKYKEIYSEIIKDYMEDKVKAGTKNPANSWWKSATVTISIIP